MNPKTLIEYTCRGVEQAGDTVNLTEFEAPAIGNTGLILVGSGEATAFLRFNKPQAEGVRYKIIVERIP